MSLNLYHHEILPTGSNCLSCETVNVVEFPDEFKERFADYLFEVEVDVIDWVKTIEAVVGIEYTSFMQQNEMFLTAGGKAYFAKRGLPNPMESASLVVIDDEQLIYTSRSDPHVTVRRCGYQRKGMKDKFFARFEDSQIITDVQIIREMLKFCDSVESMENLSEGFIDNWTDTSFVMVQY